MAEAIEKRNPRGVPLGQQRLWSLFVNRENKLRLNWFRRNEDRLNQIANKDNIRKVPSEILDLKDGNLIESFTAAKRQVLHPPPEKPPLVDQDAIKNVMRPVPKEVNNMIYASIQSDGRATYLKHRSKVIPEERYYFPETTNFEYGWKMWNATKGVPPSNFARQQVMKTSFYRRRGVDKDPEWYKEPAKLSPQVCGCI